MLQENLKDIWRLANGRAKDYTFYSASKQTWSRIDMIWATKSLTPLVKKVDILPKILSDHNPVKCVIKKNRVGYKWRLNEELLEDQGNVDFLQKEIREFFKSNWNNEVEGSIVWDASKAYLRGLLMELNSRDKKWREKILKDLQGKIREKEIKI